MNRRRTRLCRRRSLPIPKNERNYPLTRMLYQTGEKRTQQTSQKASNTRTPMMRLVMKAPLYQRRSKRQVLVVNTQQHLCPRSRLVQYILDIRRSSSVLPTSTRSFCRRPLRRPRLPLPARALFPQLLDLRLSRRHSRNQDWSRRNSQWSLRHYPLRPQAGTRVIRHPVRHHHNPPQRHYLLKCIHLRLHLPGLTRTLQPLHYNQHQSNCRIRLYPRRDQEQCQQVRASLLRPQWPRLLEQGQQLCRCKPQRRPVSGAIRPRLRV
ncbi:hypothetical protein CALVIDRAFT_217134 [Calocera viscosa TUFC12733]|uniref:Uncharacterized protein n=1 Tax=Calocera viscosa (strain TUFC12733) TaxID=1330018 RepID=A0A167RH77_CALVF|nr:hypothetical protein CALVIDRAFT_217134 [Calocera viscosa TUFC12733]